MSTESGTQAYRVPYPPELDKDDLAIVEVEGREVVVLKVGDELRAIDRECPHELGDLGEGLLLGKNIKCPVHGWIFDLSTGRCLNQRGQWAPVYDVAVEDGALRLHEISGGKT